MCGQSLTTTTTNSLPQATPMPHRHELRNAVRQFARVQKKANNTGFFYVADLSRDLAVKLVAKSDPIYGQVRDRVQKLLEESVIFDHDTHCGEIRVSVRQDAKL